MRNISQNVYGTEQQCNKKLYKRPCWDVACWFCSAMGSRALRSTRFSGGLRQKPCRQSWALSFSLRVGEDKKWHTSTQQEAWHLWGSQKSRRGRGRGEHSSIFTGWALVSQEKLKSSKSTVRNFAVRTPPSDNFPFATSNFWICPCRRAHYLTGYVCI